MAEKTEYEFDKMDLKDFIWETEEHKFEPKENRHEKVISGKKKEAQNKANVRNKKLTDPLPDSYLKKKDAAVHNDHMEDYYYARKEQNEDNTGNN